MKKLLFLPPLIYIHLFLLSNSSFTVWPEMILYPYLINHGFMLFKDIINPYFPLLTTVLSQIFAIFGLSVINLKLVTYVFIICLDVLVFLVAYTLSKNTNKTLWALVVYIFLQISLGGNGLWFELALAPFLIYSLATIFLGSGSKKQLLFSGFIFSIAILIKQNVFLFYIPVVFLLVGRKQFKNLFYFIFPGILTVFLMILFLSLNNLVNDFYFWAVRLPLSYPSQPGFTLWPTKKQYILMFFLFLPVILVLTQRLKQYEKIYWVLSSFLALSFAFPRYENFHLQVLIPLSAIFSSRVEGKKFIFFVILAGLIFAFSISKVWDKEDRFIDVPTLSLAAKIENYESVYLINSPDLAYFFANKLPPKPWAANFPWYFEQKGFQEKFISGLSEAKVEYVVVGDRLGGDKYDLGNYLPEEVMDYIYRSYILAEQPDGFTIWKLKKRYEF